MHSAHVAEGQNVASLQQGDSRADSIRLNLFTCLPQETEREAKKIREVNKSFFYSQLHRHERMRSGFQGTKQLRADRRAREVV